MILHRLIGIEPHDSQLRMDDTRVAPSMVMVSFPFKSGVYILWLFVLVTHNDRSNTRS
jgi:hypothetical protein